MSNKKGKVPVLDNQTDYYSGLYIVMKDGLLEAIRRDKDDAISYSKEISGFNLNLPLADVDVWTGDIGSKEKGKLVWSLRWAPKDLQSEVYEA